MNISILISSISHYECIGFICDALQNNIITNNNITNITIYHKNDIHKFLDYFATLYKFDIKALDSFKNETNTILIKLSEDDNILQDLDLYDKLIVILHNHNNSTQYRNTITLSPFVSNNKVGVNFYTMIPVYETNFKSYNPENIILYIGLIEDYYFTKDFIDLINNCNKYKFIIIGRSKRSNIQQYITNEKLNIECYINTDTNTLIDYVKRCKFILCRRYPFQTKRFSGAISLGISFHKPLLIQEKYNCGYKTAGFTYKELYSELIDNLNNENDENYKIKVDNMIELSTKIRTENKINMINMINNINNNNI